MAGTIIGTFGKSGKQKVYLKEEHTASELTGADVELKIKVYSKELTKMRNIK